MAKAQCLFVLLLVPVCIQASGVDILAWHMGKIARISTEDGVATQIPMNMVYTSYGLLRADVDDGFVFWSGFDLNPDLTRVTMDGTSVAIVPNTDIREFDLDRENNIIYYLNEATSQLMRTDYHGQNTQTLLSLEVDSKDLFLDPIEQKLYWRTKNIASDKSYTKFKFNRCNVDGTGMEVWFEPDSGDFPPNGADIYTALDYEHRTMYWTSGSVRKVVYIDARVEADITPNPAPEHPWLYISVRESKLYGFSKPTFDQYRIEVYDPDTQALSTVFTKPYNFVFTRTEFSTILAEPPATDPAVTAVCDEKYGDGQTLGFTKVIREGNCRQVCTDKGGLTCRVSVKTYAKLPYHVYNGQCRTIHANGCCCNAAQADKADHAVMELRQEVATARQSFVSFQ